MKELFKKPWLRYVLFITVGSGLGYSYYYFIGCNSGSCAITSNPYMSTGYGMLIGLVLSFDKGSRKAQKDDENEGGE